MKNLHKRLLELLPSQPLDAGEVTAVHPDGVTVELPTGVLIRAIGNAQIGDHVYVRGGVIEGQAPILSGIDQDI